MAASACLCLIAGGAEAQPSPQATRPSAPQASAPQASAPQPPAAKPKPGPGAPGPPLTLESVNAAGFTPPPEGAPGSRPPPDPALLKAEVLLDRAHFSPGVMDGLMGENVQNALTAYARAHKLPPAKTLSLEVWRRLTADDKVAPLKVYAITPQDVAGPFTPPVGEDFVKMAEQTRLDYANSEQTLAARFHMDQALMRALNPGKDFAKAGESIVVTDPGDAPLARVARIEVSKAGKSVIARGQDGAVLAFFPATVGSTERPSPKGLWKVKGVAQNPDYVYDPKKLTWGPKRRGKLHIPPGPEGPVGVVWIALTAPDYGIHGTPDPHLIGKSASHGCVRLTNWDAELLSRAVRPGVPVAFEG